MVVILCCIIFVVFLLVGYLVINDVVQANIFKKEVTRLEKLDINKDNYNTKLKTVGKHRVVEKKIKGYLNDYSTGLVEISKIMNDKKLSNILSIENIKEDGKDVNDSINYVTEIKNDFNEKIDSLMLASSEDKIMDNIKDINLDNYYITLYKNTMIDGKINSKLVESKYELEKTKKDFNNLLDNTLEVLNFLNSNKNNWKIENNKIMFQNSDLMNQYSLLVQKIKK